MLDVVPVGFGVIPAPPVVLEAVPLAAVAQTFPSSSNADIVGTHIDGEGCVEVEEGSQRTWDLR